LRILTPHHRPPDTLEGHITFALKYEGLDLAVLKRLFAAVGPREIESVVRNKPTGTYARRTWYLYEWLLGWRLELPDAEKGSYAEVVDTEQQWAVKGVTSAQAPALEQSARDTCILPPRVSYKGTRTARRDGSGV
jgi:hypothetical protein